MKYARKQQKPLYFSRKERLGLLVMGCLVLLIFLLPRLWPSPLPPEVDLLIIEAGSANPAAPPEFPDSTLSASKPAAQLFFFDPNTLPGEGFQQLGLRASTTATLLRYREKGGRFRKPEDLARVYGLTPYDYNRLLPFVQIQAVNQNPTPGHAPDTAYSRPVYTRSVPAAFDINTADTAAWIALPGIGSRLTARITRFREKLGGFYSIEQVGETYGLPDSVFQRIKPYLKLDNPMLKKININTATEEELKTHPYIRYALARAIVAYRNEHGLFTRTEDLKKIVLVNNEVYNRISPYLDSK